MSLEKSNIDTIARLARLSIDDSEATEFTEEINNILYMVEAMNTVNTDNLEPLAHPLEITARLRGDVVTETDQRALFQSIAPDVEEGHYLVPKVIE